MFELKFTESALDDLRCLKKFEQSLILGAVEKHLLWEPTIKTRNRMKLRPNVLSNWELRIEKYRLFYDVDLEAKSVKIKAVGWKEHNKLFIRGREFRL